MADQSKTEKATPKRRRDERKKGHIRMSRDVVAVSTLLGSLVMLRVMSSLALEKAGDIFESCFSLMANVYPGLLSDVSQQLASQCMLTVLVVAGPFLAVTALLAVVATFAQTRLLVTTEPLRPKLSKLNPIQGFKRLFSLRSVVELAKNLIKIAILLVLIYTYFRSVLPDFYRFLDMELGQACSILFDHIFNLLLRVAIAFVVVAFFDYLYQWWDYERSLRMSKEEIKEEYKQTEGDPKVKGKIKEIQRKRAMQRMMQQVPSSDVVIRNPTHVAVALRYKPDKDSAPVVVAMGVDELALRIVAVAEENQVAVVENVPLARSLYAAVTLDREIPPEFYGPVAEILVYVLKLDQQGG